MKKTKLFSQTNRTVGTTSNLPVVGRVTFDKEDNSIEVDSDKVEELQSLDFGVILLTAEQVEEKERVKAQQLANTKKKVDQQKKPVNDVQLPLVEVFENLKEGRSEEEQDYLDNLILTLQNEKAAEAEKMLTALEDKELEKLASEYPEKDVKKLTSRNKLIAFLVKKMS